VIDGQRWTIRKADMKSALYILGFALILVGSALVWHLWVFFNFASLFGSTHLNRYGAPCWLLGLIIILLSNRAVEGCEKEGGCG
jgi:hypothetical protein